MQASGENHVSRSDILPQWAPKVSQNIIRRLYAKDASGIIDDDMINEVGWALWARCDSILKVTAAHNGTIECPGCSGFIAGAESLNDNTELRCNHCGWTLPWKEYHATYKGKQLFAANAETAFRGFHTKYPRTETPSAKMILIDQLIHAFHVSITDVGRPAAANLISGSLAEVIGFLDHLSSGPDSAVGITDSRSEWKATLSKASWSWQFIDQPGKDRNNKTDKT